MIRKLLLPALLVGLLGGCVSAGYSYRDGYYYGQPSVDYRYDYGYPYGYYPGYSYGYYPYYGYPYYRRPYYYYHPNYYYRPNYNYNPGNHHRGDRDDDDRGNRPPWRDYNHGRRGDGPRQEVRVQTSPRPEPRHESRDGSRSRPALQRSEPRRRMNTQAP